MSELRRSISSNQMAELCLYEPYCVTKEDEQIDIAPKIQNYLSQSRRRHSCCSVMLPVAFERAAHRSWFDPKFDSSVLEEQFKTSVYPQIRLRFRFALAYMICCSLIWLVYFLSGGAADVARFQICSSLALIFLSSSTCLWLTYTKYYRIYSYLISLVVAISISITTLCFLGFAFTAFSPLGHFAICIEIIFIIYTVIPLPLWQCSFITIIYSITFEILTYLLQNYDHTLNYKLVIIRILLQFGIHLIGTHVLLMNVVRMRGTFMKVGQNLLVRRQLEMEKQLKEKMIHSVMPPKVADMLLTETNNSSTMVPKKKKSNEINLRMTSTDVKSLFRPFHMHSMNNVSILFADIVGFTKMSSTKNAEELVEILNDLFERFDDLCETKGCEKISTLGDCYYCVSGCPEPRPDHAICCVEMGLGMIQTMQDFDAQRHEGVKIRVGVHTGTVLCGIVGTRRVKFDVWSNDVTLANRMESTGRPEHVHITEETSSFLGDIYTLEESEEVFGHRTYFVGGRKKEGSRNSSMYVHHHHERSNSDRMSQSTLVLPELSVPPTSPTGHITAVSAGPSPIMSNRPRLASLGKVSKFLSSKKTEKLLTIQQPQIIVTAKSLPGSLNEEIRVDGGPKLKLKDDVDLTKVSKNTSFWKVPKFLRKTDNCADDKGQSKVTDIEQNGYCQLPVVIETNVIPASAAQSPELVRSCLNTLTVPNQITISMSPRENHHNHLGDITTPTGHFSMFDDIIDVRSYISQSRSDISPFGRSGSYRSQCGRSPHSNHEEVIVTRPRSSTITSQYLHLEPTLDGNHHHHHQNQHRLDADNISLAHSVTSRKDSGIRSNSRRSSIQHQIDIMNQRSLNRVSGYFTSSQSSLSNPPAPNHLELLQNQTHPDPLAACLQHLRKQSDLQLIKCVRDNAKSQRNYLVKPPISPITLFFDSASMEKDFRSKAHRFDSSRDIEGLPTLATPKYNTFLDVFVGILFYFSITISLFLLIPSTHDLPYRIWVCIFILFSCFQCFALLLCSKQICRRKRAPSGRCSSNLLNSISDWYLWNLFGNIFLSLPTISVLVNFLLQNHEKLKYYEYYYGFLLFICIIHYCNFTQLNCWMRNALAFIAAILFVGIIVVHHQNYNGSSEVLNHGGEINSTLNRAISNSFGIATNNLSFSQDANQTVINGTVIGILKTTLNSDDENDEHFEWFNDYRIEVSLDLILILSLIWFLNREFEIGYRLTFYGSAVANQDKIRVQNMKNQADMLLHNIIPKYVADQLKQTTKYSENHKDIAIIFASIVNFNELYDESYLGGKEYLRVLNELIGDFDELLSREEFQCVEKIKTIGSTFMAASGLDRTYRGDNNEHLHALLEFAISMQNVVESFNKDLLEFNLILRIGYNIGDVTAGVIGTSKLHYDIWGDSVNVASRMDSTGVPGQIQVGKDCLQYLEMKYNFVPRGKVYVKGKDDMEVYLFKDRKPDLPEDDILMGEMN